MKENDKIGYVYLTTNLANGKQYVGQHLSDGFDTKYKGSGTYIKNAINKYGWDHFKCEIVCWCSTQTQLNAAEDNYIKLLGTMYPNGYNLKEGGGANGKYSKEARKNMSEAHKGFKHTEETRKKQSEAHKGHLTSAETRKKISEKEKGKVISEETRKKCQASPKCKKVLQYTLDGKFVKEWCSLSEISRTLGLKRDYISDCCKGKRKTAYKHLWSFK